MNIIRWEPRSWLFSDLSDSFFSDFLGKVPKVTKGTILGEESNWLPNIELSQKNGSYVVKAELAGIDKKDIHVDLDDGVLTIKAEKKQEKEEKNKDYAYTEIKYGSFQRSIAVPKSIKPEDIKATYEKGLLEIILPKVEEQKPSTKRIEIK